ncbi:MAG: cytochrome c3 family protein [Coriobacteriales bacterium]|nr:cytochrome c3 family protein [Coriobacteriales bacterium]
MSDEFDSTDVPTPEIKNETPAVDNVDSETPAKPKKSKKKLFIILGIIVVVIAGGVVGGLIWHEEPTFCNAICHTPMDPYVDSYEKNISVQPSQASLATPLSVTLHKESDQKIRCLSCHVPTIDEQITEGIKWITGDYSVPLPELKYDGETFCLRPECHEGITTRDDLGKLTADLARNPHNSHLGKTECSQCHKVHEQSVQLCTQCHADAEVPDGWLTYSEQQALIKAAS